MLPEKPRAASAETQGSSMMNQKREPLSAGFGGVYTGYHVEKLLRERPSVEGRLISKENYLVFQADAAEVISGASESSTRSRRSAGSARTPTSTRGRWSRSTSK